MFTRVRRLNAKIYSKEAIATDRTAWKDSNDTFYKEHGIQSKQEIKNIRKFQNQHELFPLFKK
jgi:hypothetical protein